MIRYRPLDVWTDPVTERPKPTPFKAGWQDTLDDLGREVRALNNGRMVDVDIFVDVAGEHFRIDGGFRSNYVARSAKVVVAFETAEHGRLRYACDAFTLPRGGREAWQANVRAVALGLQALRLVTRYGIGGGHAQYTGFAAIGPGGGMTAGRAAPAETMTVEEAAAFLTRHGGGTIFDLNPPNRDAVVRAHRRAAQVLHPDHGGKPGELQRAMLARDVLLAVAS